MKHIIAINASPRAGWNTAILVCEAARGAEEAGAEAEVIDLYKLDKFTGCISCFACKLQQSWGRCACKDGLTPVLDKIRHADGLILGTPNYLGEATAGFRALFERLIFQSLSVSMYSIRRRPSPLFIKQHTTRRLSFLSATTEIPSGGIKATAAMRITVPESRMPVLLQQ